MALCHRCHKRNVDRAVRCQWCGAMMQGTVWTGGAPAAPAAVSRPAQPLRTSGMAIASLVLGLLGLFTLGLTALIGFILGIVGLRQIDRSGGTLGGRGLAIGGTVVSCLMMFVMVPIMAAILFPVFAQAREKARAATCMSHTKQVSVAMLMYAQDYDEHLPRRQNWCEAVMPYVGGSAVFHCPSLSEHLCGQAYNSQLGGIALERIASPERTVALFDGPGGWNQSGGPEMARPRHNDGIYVGFANGHVRWVDSFEGTMWKPAAVPATPVRRTGSRRGRRR